MESEHAGHAELEALDAASSFFADLEKEADELRQSEFEEFAELVEKMPECQKQYTAVLFAKHQPEKCRRVIFLLAAKWGVNRIAKTVGCSDHTVMAVKRRLPEKVAMVRESLAALTEDVLLQQLERLRDDPNALGIDKAPLTIKLLMDGLLALRGTAPPPQRVDHYLHVGAEDVNELINQARMGLEGAKRLPNGAPAGGAEGLGLAPVLDVAFEVCASGLPDTGTGDVESPVSRSTNREGVANDTGHDADGATKPEAEEGRDLGAGQDGQRGGGPRLAGGGPSADALPLS